MGKQCQNLSAQFCTTFAFLRPTFAAQRVRQGKDTNHGTDKGEMLVTRKENWFLKI